MLRAELGPNASAVADAWRRAGDSGLAGRLRAGDPSAFGAHAEGAAPWIGWLRAPLEMRAQTHDLEALARACRDDGITHAIVLGMGGSSLCPEVSRLSYGRGLGIELRVLDSTDPAAVAAAGRGLDPGRTLHIVASKSGTTVEPLAFMAHFWARAETALGPMEAARRFVVITDPETPLGDDARERGFRAVLENPADIGGRYSALSLFGLLPMALLGVPLDPLLDRAQAALAVDAGPNLGVALAALAEGGRDKVTVLADPAIGSIGLWVEQLVAESLGKEGVGLIPVADEPLDDPEAYGADRAFVYHRMTGHHDAEVAALAAAGHPVLTLELRDTLDLGAVYMAWELATAAAGAQLGVNPFDQPDVQAAKDATNRVLARMEAGEAPEDERAGPEAVAGALAGLGPGDYLALLAFCPPSPAADRALAGMRTAIRGRAGVATTVGYGPRFLHSTGQLHKGGPPSGSFVQLLSEDPVDLPVPGKPYTFGQLKRAQALGDADALVERGRRVLRVGLGPDAVAGLRAAEVALAQGSPTGG
ncbi:MAG: transaldolase / glucose-6-phosphate isomerase [Miltoncostaeaceae bacterium]|nr:transaldolase / glucose-6-phosphate isomerase [Miltoncostaeaceae bacterium]